MESKKAIKNEQVTARINKRLKKNVEKILEKLGLGHSEAINIYYSQIYLKKGIPFELMIPEGIKAEAEQEPESKKDKKKSKKKPSAKKTKKTDDLEAQFGPGSKGLDD